MAQKRAERRALEMLYGPVQRPDSLFNIQVLEEGDESNIVESTGRVVDEATGEITEPDLPDCPEHQTQWRLDNFNKWYHPNGDSFCRGSNIYGAIFRAAWTERHGSWDKAEVDGWLKDPVIFDGRTWSKLIPQEMLQAINMQKVINESPAEEENETDLE